MHFEMGLGPYCMSNFCLNLIALGICENTF